MNMPVSSEPVPRRRKIFYGWWMVIGMAILNFINGGTFYYGFTVFFNPIRNTFGWSAAETSIAFTFQRLESGIAGPITGFLVDKLGPRKLMVIGWAIVGLGFFWMSRLNSLWEFYGSFFILAVGFSFGSFVVMNAAIAAWFNKKRSRALTLVYVGFGMSGLLVPLVALTIGRIGWRETLVIVAIASWILGIPISMLMRHKPAQYGYLPDGETAPAKESVEPVHSHLSSETTKHGPDLTVTQTLRTRAFWLLSFAFFFYQWGASALAVHIVPYLESVHVAPAIAATAVTGLTVVSLAGRFGFGFLGDFRSKRHLIAIAVALQIIGLFVFSLIDVSQSWLIILFLLIYSPGYGGPIPLRPALQADYFGTKSFGTIMGLMSVITMIASLSSPVVAGWIFDVTGSYRIAWQIFALMTIPAIPLILLAKPPKAKSTT
jgi:MFS family permease